MIKDIIKPYPLKKGDTIGIIAPSRRAKESFIPSIEEDFKKLGYNFLCASNIFNHYGYLGGTDEERANGIMEMWKNPQVHAIWAATGGYGCTRILDLLDYDYIKKNPKIFIGLSDITALHIALNQKCNLLTFLGPNLSLFYNPEYQDKYLSSKKPLFDMITRSQKKVTLKKQEHFEFPFKVLSTGSARGRLVGGNLTLIAALCGTKYQLNASGKILLLEDVNEEPYKIDRMLMQLKSSQVLEGVRGVILATFYKCDPSKKESLSLLEVLDHYFGNQPYPALLGFPSGHIEKQLTLPLNALVQLDAEEGSITLNESNLQKTPMVSSEELFLSRS